MEKISGIVRTNARTAAVDLKNAAPVRPGAPSFGGPVGESTGNNTKQVSTAKRALALHNEILEAKKQHNEDQTVQRLADQFFMSRIRRPEEDSVVATPAVQVSAPDFMAEIKPKEEAAPEPALEADSDPELEQPAGYTPRGSYVDVRA